jgi:hypothetical protein
MVPDERKWRKEVVKGRLRQYYCRRKRILEALPVYVRLHVKIVSFPLLADKPRQCCFATLARAEQGGDRRAQQRS